MKIVSSEELRVATLSGAVVLFEAGVPREVADEIGHIAVQMGAKELRDGHVEKVEVAEAVIEEVVETSIQPDADLVTVLEKMMDEGDPKNFKADGYPKAAAVNKAMGRTIDTDSREAAWESILNS